MMGDIQRFFDISDAELNDMHPQNVAAKYQQSHRIERRQTRQMAHAMIAANNSKAFTALTEQGDY